MKRIILIMCMSLLLVGCERKTLTVEEVLKGTSMPVTSSETTVITEAENETTTSEVKSLEDVKKYFVNKRIGVFASAGVHETENGTEYTKLIFDVPEVPEYSFEMVLESGESISEELIVGKRYEVSYDDLPPGNELPYLFRLKDFIEIDRDYGSLLTTTNTGTKTTGVFVACEDNTNHDYVNAKFYDKFSDSYFNTYISSDTSIEDDIVVGELYEILHTSIITNSFPPAYPQVISIKRVE